MLNKCCDICQNVDIDPDHICSDRSVCSSSCLSQWRSSSCLSRSLNTSSSSTDSPFIRNNSNLIISYPKSLHLQQSILMLVVAHLARRKYKSRREEHDDPSFPSLMKQLHMILQRVGYVSKRFFDIVVSSFDLFTLTNTLHIVPQDLFLFAPLLSLFGATFHSITLQMTDFFQPEIVTEFRSVITQLKASTFPLLNHVLDHSSALYLPRLRHFDLTYMSDVTDLNWFPSVSSVSDLDSFTCICKSLSTNTTVLEFRVRVNIFNTTSSEALAEVFSSNTTLRKISLASGHPLNDECALILFTGLSQNSSVKVLDLYDLDVYRVCASLLLNSSCLASIVLPGRCTLDYSVINPLRTNESLREISLMGNSYNINNLAEILKFKCSLKKLEIRETVFQRGSELSQIFHSLKTNTNLVELIMSFNHPFNDEEVQALLDMIRLNSTLLVLDLDCLFVNSSHMKPIVNVLKMNSRLNTVIFKSLDFSGLLAVFRGLVSHKFGFSFRVSPHTIDVKNSVFCFSPKSYTQISAQQISFLQSILERFNIKNVKFRICHFLDNAITCLCDVIMLNNSLTSFDLIDCTFNFNNSTLAKLINALQSNKYLKKVSLNNNLIEFQEFLTVFELFKEHNSIETIRFSDHFIDFSLGIINYNNCLTLADLNLLSATLTSNVFIKRFNCRDVVETLSTNKSVIVFDIPPYFVDIENGVFSFSAVGSSVITVDEVTSILSFLKGNRIQLLTLSKCRFSTQTITILCDLIRANPSLRSIDLSNCNLCDDDTLGIIDALLFNGSIDKINLSYNSFGLHIVIFIFEQISLGKLSPNFEILPHAVDVSVGLTRYLNEVNVKDMAFFLKSWNSKVPIKQLNISGLRSISLKGLIVLFEHYCTNNSLSSVDVSPHFVDNSLGSISYDNQIENDDLIYLSTALKSGVPIKRVDCSGLRKPNCKGLVSLFVIHSINKSVIDIDIFPHFVDVSRGFIRCLNVFENDDLVFLLSALKSQVSINRVICRKLRNPNQIGLIALFQILSINKTLIDIDVSPYLIDVKHGVYRFSPENSTQITVELLTSLMSLSKSSRIKDLTFRRCCFCDEAVSNLYDVSMLNNSMTAFDLSDCDFNYCNFSSLIIALQSNKYLKKVILSNNLIEFQGMLTVFELFVDHNSIETFHLSDHFIDFSLGIINYNNCITLTDLFSLLSALQSNVPIKRVDCRRLSDPSLEGVITLFEILSIYNLVINLDISPHFIDFENGVFCFSPKKSSQLTIEEVSSLMSLVNRCSVKKLTLNRYCFTKESFDILCDVIMANHSLTSVDLTDCVLFDFWKFITALQVNSGLKYVTISHGGIKYNQLSTIFKLLSTQKSRSLQFLRISQRSINFVDESVQLGHRFKVSK
ncbi:hypothetical protein GEMRC1_000147 [Eukaryota sp. GEM-RC1]